MDFIDATWTSDLTLDAMAEVAGMNPFYFARAFRRQFGETPHRSCYGAGSTAPKGC